MTINLPSGENTTGPNLWSEVYNNDKAIKEAVEALQSEVGGLPLSKTKTYPATVIGAEQSTSSTTFVRLATPDEVTGVVLPANGLIRVGYIAIWSSTVAGAGRAILAVSTLGALPSAQNSTTEATTNGTSTTYLSTQSASTPLASGRISTEAVPVAFQSMEIFASAGTYSVGVSFAATSGTVKVKERKLWVSVTTF